MHYHPIIIFIVSLLITTANAFSQTQKDEYRTKVKDMFSHAYNAYLDHAYPYDELKPLTCKGQDTWGKFKLTLIDSLSTNMILGNYTEFHRVVNLILESVTTDIDVNVSIFETNIRVIGGLLSAHILQIRDPYANLTDNYPCAGPLLDLAREFANKLLPAFRTTTGMPYGTVNLKYGVNKNETPITCTACIGTLIVEFGTLTRLTGDPIYESTAMKALNALWKTRSEIGLVGNHIDVMTGKWTATDATIGAAVDSYYEYLAKGAILFQKPELMVQFKETVKVVNKHLRKDDWFTLSFMETGGKHKLYFQSLEAFWPGVLALTGSIDEAQRILLNYAQIIRHIGVMPEIYDYPNKKPLPGREGFPLRPEFVESLMYVYKATKDDTYLQIAAGIVDTINLMSKVPCGYSTVKNVITGQLDDRMESFFLAETVKYLYLIFDENNFIHNDGSEARIIDTDNGKCVVEAGGYIFNTEAHPIDPSMLYCCDKRKEKDLEMIDKFKSNINFLELLNIDESNVDSYLAGKEVVDEVKDTVPQQDEETANIDHKLLSEVIADIEENTTGSHLSLSPDEEKTFSIDGKKLNDLDEIKQIISHFTKHQSGSYAIDDAKKIILYLKDLRTKYGDISFSSIELQKSLIDEDIEHEVKKRTIDLIESIELVDDDKSWLLSQRVLTNAGSLNSVRFNNFTAQQAASALRPFYFEVHPDRFAKDPLVRQKNEKSLQIFNGYLNELYPVPKAQKPIEVNFSIRCKKTEKFINICVPLTGNDPRRIVRSALEKCELDTKKVPEPIENKSKVEHYETPSSASYSKREAEARWRSLHEQFYSKKKKKPIPNELLNALSKNHDFIREKMRNYEEMKENFKDEIAHLQRVVGLVDVRWTSRWEHSYLKRCLLTVSLMYKDAEPEVKTKIMYALHGYILNFGRGSHVCCNGNIQFGADDVPKNWLQVCLEATTRRNEINILHDLKSKVKSLLGNEFNLILDENDCILRTVTEYKTIYLRLKRRNKEEINKLRSLLKGSIIEVTSTNDELSLDKNGRIFIPCNVEYSALIQFLEANVEISKHLTKNLISKICEAESLQKTCVIILQLKDLSWDDTILIEDLRKCLTRLENATPEIKDLIKGMHVKISNNPNIYVMNDGKLVIPVDWI
uniref:Alpha-1,2-Mannosidase n=1 Tax=Rhabditophanes sp. KR3021 TaxID=114890 RepID=A0AC35TYK7_9BILA